MSSPLFRKYSGVLGPQGGLVDPDPEIFTAHAQQLVEKELVSQRLSDVVTRSPEYDSEKYDPVTVPSTAGERARSFTNLLFGPELSLLGLRWEQDGWNWNLENTKRQLTEEPLLTNLMAGAGIIATVASPLSASFRFGRLGKAMGKGAAVKDVTGILGSEGQRLRWFDRFKDEREERSFLKQIGVLEESLGDDIPERMMKKARIKAHDKLYQIDVTMRRMQDETFGSVVKARKDRLVASGMGDENAAMQQAATEILREGKYKPASWTAVERGKNWFDQRFANRYFDIVNDTSPHGQFRRSLQESLDKFSNTRGNDKYRTMAQGLLGQKAFVAKFYHHALQKAYPGANLGTLPKLSPEERKVTDSWLAFLESTQDRAKSSSFMAPDAPNVHLTALRRRGVDLPNIKGLAKASSLMESLLSPTMLKRESSPEEILGLAKAGALAVDDVKALMYAGFADDMLLFNFETMRDLIKSKEFKFNPFGNKELKGSMSFSIIPHDKMMTTYKDRSAVPGNYVSLDEVFLNQGQQGYASREALVRMLLNTTQGAPDMVSKDGRLPWIPKFMKDALFDEQEGMFAQAEAVTVNVLEMASLVHKTSKTGFNPATHTQNILGNIAFMMQAGFNPFVPRNLKLLRESKIAFDEIHKAHKEVREVLLASGKDPARMAYRDVKDLVAGRLKSLNRTIEYVNDAGKTARIPLDELADRVVQQVYEEGSFEAVEGYSAILRSIPRATNAAKKVGRSFLKIYDNPMTQSTGIKKVFDTMTEAYLGEDVIPKIAMYLKNRAEGLTKLASVDEVARRMPMYGTIGGVLQDSRRYFLPWVSFPVEALRITKNNLLDNPLRTIPWLYGAQMMQGLVSAAGFGEGTREAVRESERALPLWAQTPSTVMTAGGEAAHASPGILTGTAVGGLMGAAFGGIPGAAMGAVAGAGLGSLPIVVDAFREKEHQGAHLRGAAINWLPHSSFLLRMDSPDYPLDSLRNWFEVSPVEPMPILRGILDVVEGRTSFGEEVPNSGLLDATMKTVAGAIGFLAPPLIQKYGFKTTTPDVGISDYLALRAFGRAAPDLMTALDPTNITRLLVDSGIEKDAVTGIPGSPIYDLLLSNVGTLKSYPAVAERFFANLQMNTETLENVRSFHSRNLRFYVENADEEGSADIMRRVFMTYMQEHPDNPTMAIDKYQKWVKSKMNIVGRHPNLSSYSEEELNVLFEEAHSMAKDVIPAARKERLIALQKERAMRRLDDYRRRFLKEGAGGGSYGP
jgi:hypothetical protein